VNESDEPPAPRDRLVVIAPFPRGHHQVGTHMTCMKASQLLAQLDDAEKVLVPCSGPNTSGDLRHPFTRVYGASGTHYVLASDLRAVVDRSLSPLPAGAAEGSGSLYQLVEVDDAPSFTHYLTLEEAENNWTCTEEKRPVRLLRLVPVLPFPEAPRPRRQRSQGDAASENNRWVRARNAQ